MAATIPRMNDDVRNIVLGVIATALSGGFGWFTRTYQWRRALRRKQAFFGLPTGSDCLFVVNRQMGGTLRRCTATMPSRCWRSPP